MVHNTDTLQVVSMVDCAELIKGEGLFAADFIKPLGLLFVFVALRPMSTAMVIAGRSVHLTTLFPGQA